MHYVELKNREGTWHVGAVYDETIVAFEPVFDGVNMDVIKVEDAVAQAIPPLSVYNKEMGAFEADMDNIRYSRSNYLSLTDKYLAADYTGPALDDDQRAALIAWRTRLKDIPQDHEGDPAGAMASLIELIGQRPALVE